MIGDDFNRLIRIKDNLTNRPILKGEYVTYSYEEIMWLVSQAEAKQAMDNANSILAWENRYSDL